MNADRRLMLQALDLAGRAVGSTSPNPPVGAVVVREGLVLGEGWTQPIGHDHAEVAALKDCVARGHDPRGATMYVTLEPCCVRNHGRAPTCTDAIVAAKLHRVVIGTLDPFPAMRGRSVGLLREAGLAVEVGVEQERCARRVLGFARAVVHGLPEVTLKAGMTADGRIATATGQSKWITSDRAREAAHVLRARHDAVMVGIGTVLADDPSLTTRLPEGSVPGQKLPRNAVPVVLDSELRIPAGAKLLSSGARAVVIAAEDAPVRELSADIVRVGRAPGGRIELTAALRALAARGLHRILVEGGSELARSLLEQRLADTLELFVAPLLLPGGIPVVGGEPIARLADGIPLELVSAEPLGPDLHVVYHLAHGWPDPVAGLHRQAP
jgi:diaminohydroxyphosphoribosylaminopyrimidine deaminase/5-amino-6-(5-phosphoribosylamino)uracil reductase